MITRIKNIIKVNINNKRIRNLFLKFIYKSKGIIIGENLKLGKNVRMKLNFGGSIEIGNNCEIEDGVILETYGGRIKIGDNTFIGPYSVLYGHGGLIIGKRVLIAAHSIVIPANHLIWRNQTIYEQGETRKGIKIEDDVWLGAGVKVLDGVEIGKGCVIAAGAVVNKSTLDYCIYAGVPIKKIGERENET